MTELTNIGAQMANVMFNLAQRPGEPLTSNDVAIMDKLRKEWDEGRRATPSSDCALGPLPPPTQFVVRGLTRYVYTAEQVEQIRREAVEADRRARASNCRWPLCESEQVQQEVAAQVHGELYSGEQPASAAQGVKTWQERTGNHNIRPGSVKHMLAEIADLRAQLGTTQANLQTAVQEAWTRMVALHRAQEQLARQSQEPQAYMIRDKREYAGHPEWSKWKPCSIEDYELRKEHTDIFEFQPLVAAPAHPVAQPALRSQLAAKEQGNPVAMVTKGSKFGPGLAFLGNGQPFPAPGTLLYLNAPAGVQSIDREKLREMHNDEGEIGWYFDCDGHYIDVERDAAGKYSVYFRNRKDQSEAWLDQSEGAQPALRGSDAPEGGA
jgi:hypothetical protein